MTIEESVIYLASCAVNSRVPDQDVISQMDLEKVCQLAEKHKIGCCVAIAIESAGYSDTRTKMLIAKAIRRNSVFEASLKEVTGQLQEEEIAYTLLKGIILKKYYPLEFMREMADHDILIDDSRAEDVRGIMEGLGFTTKRFGKGIHDIYHKHPLLNYEMHRTLFKKSRPRLYAYYKEIKDLSKTEDFYLYIVAHEYMHYSAGGTGLRSLLDIYLFLRKESLDWNYVEEEAGKIGIRRFEKDNRLLATNLFRKGVVTDENMLSYILSSYAYGTYQHKVDNNIRRIGGGRFNYILYRLMIPIHRSDPRYQIIADKYPLFYKYKFLLPVLPFYRVFNSLRTGKMAPEWRAIWRKDGKDKL